MSVADTVRTGKRSLQFFRGGSKFKVYIGNPASREDSHSGSRPDVVVLDNEKNGKFNLCADEILSSYLNILNCCGL